MGIRQRRFYTRGISSPNPRHRSGHPLLLPAPAGPWLPPSSPCCRVCSPAPPSSRGLPGDAGGNSENGFGNAALCLCFGLTPPKRQQAGGAGRGEAASPPGAAGKAPAGSTRSLTAETRTVRGGEKLNHRDAPAHLQPQPKQHPASSPALWGKGVGNEGITSPRAELSHWPLPSPVAFDYSGPLLGTQKPSAQSPSPLQRSKHHLKPPATAALRFPHHFLHASSFAGKQASFGVA